MGFGRLNKPPKSSNRTQFVHITLCVVIIVIIAMLAFVYISMMSHAASILFYHTYV